MTLDATRTKVQREPRRQLQRHVAWLTLDNEVTRQSLMIGYIDDFKLMMLITLTVIPLVFFLRKPARPPAAPMAAAAE